MTMKHIKFQDSEVMRSFEQVAYKRGLIKPEDNTAALVKNAASKIQPTQDLSPTDNASENILKLCTGLRAKGFVTYANNLETKFLQLKQAERGTHLYRAHDEDGEDLLEFAHPDGSVEMAEATDELGVVEDRLDQHRKSLEVVNKMPTGKLAACEKLLAMVKVVLADDATDKIQIAKFLGIVSSAINWVANKIKKTTPDKWYVGFPTIQKSLINNIFERKDKVISLIADFNKDPSNEKLALMRDQIIEIRDDLLPKFDDKEMPAERKASIIAQIKLALDNIETVKQYLGEEVSDDIKKVHSEVYPGADVAKQLSDFSLFLSDVLSKKEAVLAKIKDDATRKSFNDYMELIDSWKPVLDNQVKSISTAESWALSTFPNVLQGTSLEKFSKFFTTMKTLKGWTDHQKKILTQYLQLAK